MSKLSLGNFDRIEIFEPRPVRRAHGIQMVHGIGIVVLLVLAIIVTMAAYLGIAELYQIEPTSFPIP
jgi:hypothetical protein